MQQPSSLEERVRLLEKEVASLKERVGVAPQRESWIAKITGTFEGDEEFAKIVELGAELRRADRPGDDDR
ncbi:MAG TPA: hypothetical protein VG125_05515 [Pirellulales bacterium]|jgi:hypothetical protein|nr:hypothetical protein [Pirellulales bacterium]